MNGSNTSPKRARRGPYLGVSLATWRTTIRSLRESGWWLMWSDAQGQTPAEERHEAVLAAARYLVSREWLRKHQARFRPQHYVDRRARLAIWCPLRKEVTPIGQG